jgi:hypothetical protein
MQDRPTAAELLKAARAFCEDELGPALTGRLRFQVRVLQNILGILEREWENEEDAVRAEYARLQPLLGLDEAPDTFKELRERVRAANVDLAKKIRAGDLDDCFDETLDALHATATEKLAIANPNWF